MSRDDWRHRDEDQVRRAARRSPTEAPRDDFGQADYSTDYVYDPHSRTGHRAEADLDRDRRDYGQADYSSDWAYDNHTGRAYRRYGDEGPAPGAPPPAEPPRSWMDRAGGFLGAGRHRQEHDRAPRRSGSSDRVLWAVIVERLEDERRLDLRDVEVIVERGEVTLNGSVRRKQDKRRIEDIADIDGVGHVQNNLRVHERGWF